MNLSTFRKVHVQDPERDRLTVGYCGNTELLPFESESFDCFLSHAMVQIVDNVPGMLSEAFRILQKGATIAISTWGNPDESPFCTILPGILKQNGYLKERPGLRSYFYYNDESLLKDELEKAGFKKVKYWRQPLTYAPMTFEDYWNWQSTFVMLQRVLNGLSGDELKLVKEQAEEQFDKLLGSSVVHYTPFNLLMMVGLKE